MAKTEAKFTIEIRFACVWVVKCASCDEVDSVWATEELAEKEKAISGSDGLEVVKWEIGTRDPETGKEAILPGLRVDNSSVGVPGSEGPRLLESGEEAPEPGP